MTDYELLLIEIRSALSRYFLKSQEDIPFILRRLSRNLKETDWESLLHESAERLQHLEHLRETKHERHIVGRNARIVYAQCMRAKAAGVAHDLTLEQWETAIISFDGLCAYCQEKPYEILEHFLSIPLGGTTVANCIPACQTCNNKKNKHTPSELADYFPQENIHHIREFLARQETHKENP